jgi:hypothetical protein
MKFAIIFITLSLLSQTIWAQNPPSKSDLKKVERELDSLKHSITLLDNSIDNALIEVDIRAQSQIDSLQKELIYYRVKEDYYSDALAMQTAIFGIIIAILVSGASLISWKYVKYKFIQIKEYTEKQLADVLGEFNIIDRKFDGVTSDLYTSEGNLAVSQGLISNDNKQFHIAFNYYVIGGVAYSRARLIKFGDAEDTATDQNYHSVITSLENAKDIFKSIKTQGKYKDHFKKYFVLMNNEFNSISQVKNQTVIDLLAELRVSVKDYIS